MERRITFIGQLITRLLISVVAGMCAFGQTQPKDVPCGPAERPYYGKKALVDILNRKRVTAPRLSELIRTCGVTFTMFPKDEADLRAFGASDAVIEAIRSVNPAAEPADIKSTESNKAEKVKSVGSKTPPIVATKRPMGRDQVPAELRRPQQRFPSDDSLESLKRTLTSAELISLPFDLRSGIAPDFLTVLRSRVLNVINEHRGGTDPVSLLGEEPIANQVASAHALDLIQSGSPVSHLSANGFAPWMRFSYMHGNGYIRETVADYTLSLDQPTAIDPRIPQSEDCIAQSILDKPTATNIADSIYKITTGLVCGIAHQRPSDNPRADADKRVLLDKNSNAVGIGVACREVRGKGVIRIIVVLDYISQYLKGISPVPFTTLLTEQHKIELSATVSDGYEVEYAELNWQKLDSRGSPSSRDVGSVGSALLDFRRIVDYKIPKARYANGSAHILKSQMRIDGQKFTVPLEFWHGAGVYTLVINIAKVSKEPFPGPFPVFNQSIVVK
jgi:hypothetical protein